MNKLTDIREIRRLAADYGFNFSKSLGQNFLTDQDVVEQTAGASAENGIENVIEIGPGFGVLTRELAAVYKGVVAIELDETLFPVLEETLADLDNVTVFEGDAMKVNLNEVAYSHFGEGTFNVAANLPYYITTPIITSLLESGANIGSITVMIQKEVADRLAAAPGEADCGAISAAVAYRCRAVKLFDVPPSSFVPAPKVTSSVIRLDMLKRPSVNVKDEKLFFDIVKAAFGQRRKTLCNALVNSSLNIPREKASDAIGKVGLRADIRGEKLSLQNFADLSDEIYKIKQGE